jgi:hypothetical protein
MLAGELIPIIVDTFQNELFGFTTKDQLYTLLIHLGYLTLNEKDGAVYIPNREVMEVFKQDCFKLTRRHGDTEEEIIL